MGDGGLWQEVILWDSGGDGMGGKTVMALTIAGYSWEKAPTLENWGRLGALKMIVPSGAPHQALDKTPSITGLSRVVLC
jgi:hypothetical protein